MKSDKINLLTLISYQFSLGKSGGQLAHIYFHNYISEYLNTHIAGTYSNDFENETVSIKFQYHKVFGKISPYIPLSYLLSLRHLVKKEHVNVVMCSHPYMGITAYVLSKISKTSLVSYSHNIESTRFQSLGKWWWKILFYYEKWVLQVSKIVFFVAEEDRKWAVQNYNLNENKCIVSPFGINLQEIPEKSFERRNNFKIKYKILENEKILYFVGTYNYAPNDKAVLDIIDNIYPKLMAQTQDFKILIIGKGLNEKIVSKINKTNNNIIYVGFVENIRDILDSADIMLNPMLSGGGIKTKAVEALGNNIKVISTENGAGGLDSSVCGDMLLISKDNDWNAYVENIISAMKLKTTIPNTFYDHYFWGNVTKRVADGLVTLISLPTRVH